MAPSTIRVSLLVSACAELPRLDLWARDFIGRPPSPLIQFLTSLMRPLGRAGIRLLLASGAGVLRSGRFGRGGVVHLHWSISSLRRNGGRRILLGLGCIPGRRSAVLHA